jgi:hypothetical protein
MYIVLEIISFDHPALSKGLTLLDQYAFGPITCGYIASENETTVDLTGVNYVEVPENVARACKFGKVSHANTIKILQGSDIHQELIVHSMEEHAVKPQLTYTLNDSDISEVIEFYKASMKVLLTAHYNNLDPLTAERNANLKASILNEIDSCTTLLAARDLIHNKFGISTSSVVKDENNWGEATVNLSV